MAFPIKIHNYLVGVAMTGQIFFKLDDIKNVESFINSNTVGFLSRKSGWDTLRGKENKLKESQIILMGHELMEREQKKARFFLDGATEEEKRKLVEEKRNLLRPNLNRLEEIAESRYRDFRTKVEYTFRQELLGYIEKHKRETSFFDEHILYVLKRMREFWAFKAVYLTCYSFKTRGFSIIAKSVFGKDNEEVREAFEITGEPRGEELVLDEEKFLQLHPAPCLYRRSEGPDMGPPFDNMARQLNTIIINEDKNALEVSPKDYIFTVLIPSGEEFYAFTLAVRDEDAVCSLKHANPKSVSVLCQDAIVEACCEIVYEFYNARADELHRNAMEQLKNTHSKEKKQIEADKQKELGARQDKQTNQAKKVEDILGQIEVHLDKEETIDKGFLKKKIDVIREVVKQEG
jgi:hypothetical protein